MPHLPSFWFGTSGDFLTFLGAVVLAWDLINAVRKFENEKWRAKTIELLTARNIPVQNPSGERVKTKDEVHLGELRQTARWAAFGVIIITLGAALQVVARFFESNEVEGILRFLRLSI